MGRPVILVLRNDQRFSSVFRENGYEVINLEIVVTEKIDDLDELAVSIGPVDRYDGFFFTSPVAAEGFVRILEHTGSRPGGKLYVLGERTKRVFEGTGFEVITRRRANTAVEFIESFDNSEFEGKRFLFVRGDQSMRTIPDRLAGIATIDEIVVYKSVEKPPGDDMVSELRNQLRRGGIDWICVFSPSGIDGFAKYFTSADFARAKFAVIGETTAGWLRESGIAVAFVSQRASANDFAEGLISHIKSFE